MQEARCRAKEAHGAAIVSDLEDAAVEGHAGTSILVAREDGEGGAKLQGREGGTGRDKGGGGERDGSIQQDVEENGGRATDSWGR